MLSTLRTFSRRHRRLTGLLCLLLLLFGTTLQVTHSHLPNENHSDCALCVTAHAAVELVVQPALGVLDPAVRLEEPPREAHHAVAQVIWAHALWNRPPPSACPFA